MAKNKYSLHVVNTVTDDEYDLPFESLNFTEELNKGKNMSASLDYKAVEQIAEVYSRTPIFILTGGLREIRVEKEGVPVYLGVISDINFGKNDNALLRINVASVGLGTMLKKRRTDELRKFVSTDAGTIGWTLIDESQLSDVPYSDLGITQGLIQTSVNRDRTFRFANVRDEIFKMSNENLKNGFDFEVSNLKKFNVFYPQKGSQRPNLFIDDQNIIGWQVRKPLILNLTTQTYVIGAGFDTDLLFSKRTSDVAYRQTFGLLEEVLSERDIETIGTLEDKGDRFLLENQSPKLNLRVSHKDDEPDILNYSVGDSLRFFIPEVELNNDWRRVAVRNINVDNQGQAIVTITID